mmetsp:Transcript_11602/g.26914  ORF Transcript_11602/g.26914 Transcript_11602/m.26914 type:complete len:94 (-) Transcript_11602:81-362(-)
MMKAYTSLSKNSTFSSFGGSSLIGATGVNSGIPSVVFSSFFVYCTNASDIADVEIEKTNNKGFVGSCVHKWQNVTCSKLYFRRFVCHDAAQAK